ncbi:hypothetical protein BH10BAC2_BH10BAC2_37650 [soil metagenome]
MSIVDFIKRSYGYVYRRTLSRLYINTNSDLNNTVLLASMGRGGSTLVSEILNYDNRFRIVFEPMKLDQVIEFKDFAYPTYLAPSYKDENTYAVFKKAFEGKIRTNWTDSQNKKFICKYRLVKEIRANFMLGWINNNFPEVPLIILLRNPYALAESWSRANWPVLEFKKQILEQQKKLQEVLPAGVLSAFNACENVRDLTIHIWCMSYYLPLKQLGIKNYCLLYYENFIKEPESEIRKLFSFLKLEFKGNATALIGKESSMTRQDSPLKKGENILVSWKKKYTDEDIVRGNSIIQQYGLFDLYDFTDTFMPSDAIKLSNPVIK